jgi:glucosyl-3-phosphoglycerate synthase
MDVDLARVNRIPGDWGLEVGVLAEVYRNTSHRRVCQVDIAENYEHKHQDLSPSDITKGLNKMSIDICKSIFRTLASEGIVFSEGFFKTLVATYVRTTPLSTASSSTGTRKVWRWRLLQTGFVMQRT